jgi:predicted nucleic acid-binding protein
MDVVADTSAIIAVIANEPEKERIVQSTQGSDILAPFSVHWEIGNAFSAMLKRQRITITQARQALQAYHSIPIRFVEIELEKSLEIAAELGIYAYDAYLLRCAQRYSAPLLSLDLSLREYALQLDLTLIEVSP